VAVVRLRLFGDERQENGKRKPIYGSVSGMTRSYHAALASNAAQALRKTNRTAARTTDMQKTPRVAIIKP
jgi:hypothetical protein